MRRPGSYPEPRYKDPKDRRLMQIIRRSAHATDGSVNILGIPFDGATLGRKGAAGGPEGIRRAISGFSNYNIELGIGLEGAKVSDLGDVVVPRDDVEPAHRSVEAEVAAGLKDDSLLALLGGDNSISLPSLRAFAKRFDRVGLIVVDSHLDLRGNIGGKPTSGSSYGLAISEGLVDPKRVVEVGAHGFLNSREYVEKARKLGVEVMPAQSLAKMGAKAAAHEAYGKASKGADAVYLSIDMDVFDLAFVPGVSAPSSGGLGPQQVFDFVFEVAANKGVKCADIVELAPVLDPAGTSERVAASVLTYIIAGFVSRKGRPIP